MGFLKGTKIYSIFTGKCPVCHNESMYKESNPYKLPRTLEMHERCSHCKTKYKIEPSFFYGAMYINYGITVAIAVIVFVISKIGFELNLLRSFIYVLISLLILAPLNLRLSRILWINIFVSYSDKEKTSN